MSLYGVKMIAEFRAQPGTMQLDDGSGVIQKYTINWDFSALSKFIHPREIAAAVEGYHASGARQIRRIICHGDIRHNIFEELWQGRIRGNQIRSLMVSNHNRTFYFEIKQHRGDPYMYEIKIDAVPDRMRGDTNILIMEDNRNQFSERADPFGNPDPMAYGDPRLDPNAYKLPTFEGSRPEKASIYVKKVLSDTVGLKWFKSVKVDPDAIE